MEIFSKIRQPVAAGALLLSSASFASYAASAAKTAIDVPNAGFEDGCAGWTGGASMSLDTNVFHGGGCSARLDVADPMKDSVYITQLIPVKGGALYEASCFVKTENVRDAEGKKNSVGAGLIVEWADSKKKWIQAGEYACGRYGT